MALLALPPWLLGTLFVVIAVIAGTVPFYLIRRRWPQETPKDSRELGAQVALRVSVLYSVILGMVFADVQSSYSDVKRTVQQEVSTLIGVYTTLQLLDSREAREIQRSLQEYANQVVRVEWPALGSREGSVDTGKLLVQIYLKAVGLPHNDTHDITVRDNVIEGMNEMKRLHRARLIASVDEVPYLFWWVVVFGFVIIGALFTVFMPTPLNIVLVSAFCAMTGIVLFFIFVMSNPFLGPAKIAPTPFELFIDKARAHLHAEQSSRTGGSVGVTQGCGFLVTATSPHASTCKDGDAEARYRKHESVSTLLKHVEVGSCGVRIRTSIISDEVTSAHGHTIKTG